MALSSSAKEWINRQTSMEKLSLGLVWLTLPDVVDLQGCFKLAATVILTGWIWHRQKQHQERMSNFEP